MDRLFPTELGIAETSFSAGLHWGNPATFFPPPIWQPGALARQLLRRRRVRSDGHRSSQISSGEVLVIRQSFMLKERNNKFYG
jgi:hypothetical protein